MLTTQLLQHFFIKSTVIPKSLHLSLQALGIEITEDVHQLIQLLFVLCSCK